MPPPLPKSPVDRSNPFRVLVTGFGPFPPNHTGENPSWLAVRELNDAILHTVLVDRLSNSAKDGAEAKFRSIHITTLQVPVIYQDVLNVVPGIHSRPPILPGYHSTLIPTPDTGYDFVLHVGVAGRGPLRLEKVGHKLGYLMKDASGNLAPIVYSRKQDFSASLRGLDKVSEAEKTERERLSAGGMENTGETVPVERPVRGYGKGYEIFADDLHTDVDVDKLVHDMKRSGIKDIYASMDAGHYLCDFIFFGSLAENKRRVSPDERPHQVLFLHCPPVNQPHSTDEVTEAIRRIVVWVCSELQSADTFNGLSQ